jgi:hypothetical protein
MGMKKFLTFQMVLLLAIFAAANLYAEAGKKAPAASPLPQGAVITGKVVETMDSGGYTYMLLETGGRKTWFAVPEMKVKVGQTISLANGVPMVNYESKTLKRRFDLVIFSPGPAKK